MSLLDDDGTDQLDSYHLYYPYIPQAQPTNPHLLAPQYIPPYMLQLPSTQHTQPLTHTTHFYVKKQKKLYYVRPIPISVLTSGRSTTNKNVVYMREFKLLLFRSGIAEDA